MATIRSETFSEVLERHKMTTQERLAMLSLQRVFAAGADFLLAMPNIAHMNNHPNGSDEFLGPLVVDLTRA